MSGFRSLPLIVVLNPLIPERILLENLLGKEGEFQHRDEARTQPCLQIYEAGEPLDVGQFELLHEFIDIRWPSWLSTQF